MLASATNPPAGPSIHALTLPALPVGGGEPDKIADSDITSAISPRDMSDVPPICI
jgi:hypothetical protein